jgi:hypothetical protein
MQAEAAQRGRGRARGRGRGVAVEGAQGAQGPVDPFVAA